MIDILSVINSNLRWNGIWGKSIGGINVTEQANHSSCVDVACCYIFIKTAVRVLEAFLVTMYAQHRLLHLLLLRVCNCLCEIKASGHSLFWRWPRTGAKWFGWEPSTPSLSWRFLAGKGWSDHIHLNILPRNPQGWWSPCVYITLMKLYMHCYVFHLQSFIKCLLMFLSDFFQLY